MLKWKHNQRGKALKERRNMRGTREREEEVKGVYGQLYWRKGESKVHASITIAFLEFTILTFATL